MPPPVVIPTMAPVPALIARAVARTSSGSEEGAPFSWLRA